MQRITDSTYFLKITNHGFEFKLPLDKEAIASAIEFKYKFHEEFHLEGEDYEPESKIDSDTLEQKPFPTKTFIKNNLVYPGVKVSDHTKLQVTKVLSSFFDSEQFDVETNILEDYYGDVLEAKMTQDSFDEMLKRIVAHCTEKSLTVELIKE